MAITPGGSLNSVALPQKQTLSTNYIDFTAQATAGWAQQYLPDLMEKEAEVFGNRSISGFLSQVGAEEAMASDQVIWSEQGRLHLSYNGAVVSASDYITIGNDIDGQTAGADHGIRIGDTVIVSSATQTKKCYVCGIGQASGIASSNLDRVYVLPYVSTDGTLGTDFSSNDAVVVLVYGSEYAKGKTGRTGANSPKFTTFTNKPMILKDKYEISGSDASAIGWVEISGEDGQNGYMWYLKAEGDTRTRFADYLEMAMLEAVRGDSNNTIDTDVDFSAGGFSGIPASGAGAAVGSEGLFSAIETRGNMTSGVTGVNWATDLAEFDAILAEFDKQGSIEENMMFVNRSTSLAIDDMLAGINGGYAGGASFGVFNNEEDMALNLGFSGFRRGSYDFYKSDFKYLNDKGTRGGLLDTVNAIRGVIIPAGVTSVYDQSLGKNLKRPFLHVRYRSSQTDDRRMKTWVTGSVGAVTSDLDAMEIHYLSERCLIVQGANNFMLMN
tara:strand:+ start:5187 stop:6677 length:1491 start_codon:yes stop_codon:yes gene_type:complete